MRKTRLLAVATVALLAAGCSAGSSTPTPTPAAVTTTAAASGPASAGPCPDGAYVVTALEGRGTAAAAGKGSGGDIAASFTSGTFTISSDGAEPVKLDLGPVNAEMRFDGEITGTYEGDPSALALKTTGAHGDVGIKGFGVSRSYTAGGLADQLIGQAATAQVTCDDAAGTAVVVLPNVRLTLARA